MLSVSTNLVRFSPALSDNLCLRGATRCCTDSMNFSSEQRPRGSRFSPKGNNKTLERKNIANWSSK